MRPGARQTVTAKVTTEFDISVTMLAEIFAGLDDDSQAQFFCEVARIAREAQESGDWHGPPNMQWHFIGRHLRDCECSTEGGREMVREICAAIDQEPQ